ncbi:MAG TPA: MarR family transcriptional regulator [Bryobacteraceae bacterium]|nr:MarR family transcriptional regulator [Bryobacteraceae bacterium]
MATKTRVDAPRLWTVLTRCYHAMSQIAGQSVERARLSPTSFAALEALLHKGPLTITELQSKVLLASGSMTAAVDRLETQGWVVRRPSPGDRRARVVELTPTGRAVIEVAFQRHAVELEAATAILSATEKRELHALLKKLGLYAVQALAAAKETDI